MLICCKSLPIRCATFAIVLQVNDSFNMSVTDLYQSCYIFVRNIYVHLTVNYKAQSCTSVKTESQRHKQAHIKCFPPTCSLKKFANNKHNKLATIKIFFQELYFINFTFKSGLAT